MNGKKVEDRYKTRNKNISSRGYSSQRTGDKSSLNNSRGSSQSSSRSRDYDDRSRIRRKGRAGCLVSVLLLIVVLAGLYILIFKSPLFDGRDKQLDNASVTPNYTQLVESTPTPTLKPESTNVPEPTTEPVCPIGYISTFDKDGSVRMRTEPDSSSDIVGKLHNREVVYLLEIVGDYYKIRHRGDMVYVHKDYVEEHMPEDNMLCDVVTKDIKYSKLVEVTSIIPSLIVEMPYATGSNHVNKQMYPFELVLLQESTAYKLKKAQELFLEDGYSIVLWDAYRPYSVTIQTFAIIGDPLLAADPERGSRHNKGAAVDITLYDLNNDEYVNMPTEVREMNLDLVKRSSKKMTYEQRKNMEYMEKIMAKAGFSPYSNEWWHYNDMDVVEYPVLDIQFEAWGN